jgi:hypothetical protein
MVLKLVLFIMLLTTSAYAKKSARTIYFKTAQKQYLKKNYKKSIKTLEKYYDIRNPKKLPTPVLQLLALNFLKTKQLKSSSRYFHYVIRRRYKKLHRRVINSLKNESLEDIKVPQKLLRIYYHLGEIYYKIYYVTKSTSYFRASEKYFNICEIKEHLDDNAAEYLENLAKLKVEVDNKEFKSEWFANIGTLNWQEKLELQSQTSGSKTKLLSNARALCIGGGYRYSNSFHGIEISACGFSGSAKVTANNTATYSQNGVGVSGFLIDSGYIIKPKSDKGSLTISLPLFYRDGEYSQPEGFSILGQGQLSAGVMLKGRYELPLIDFTTSIGSLGWTNLFLMQAGYTF